MTVSGDLSNSGTLASLPPLLRNEPAMASVLGSGGAVLAVAEPARAYVTAGVAHLSSRRPILAVTATAAEADRLAHDLGAYLGPADVDTFPAWETLPFERVSPSIETMGRRLRAMWRLGRGSGEEGLGVLVAPVKALIQRLGLSVEDTEPVVIAPGDVFDPHDLLERLVASGYRREYQVEHRGELAARGGIVDVFGSTADFPVRAELWGDEVDRLTEFDAGDQRSFRDIDRVEIFGCRELVPTPAVRERALALVGEQPWGRGQWERLAEGLVFDGMESWLPWLSADEHMLPDLLGTGAQVVLFDPRRIRDRAGELIDEEGVLGSTLSQTWGATGHEFPRLHLPFDRLLAHTDAPVWWVTSVPESPATPVVEARGWEPMLGDGTRLVGQLRQLMSEGYRVTVSAEGSGSASRLAAALAEEGLAVSVVEPDGAEPLAAGELTAPGIRVVVQPLERGFVMPATRLAVLAESDVTGRRRPHRVARPPALERGVLRRPGAWRLRGAPPPRGGALRRHGQARYRRLGA